MRNSKSYVTASKNKLIKPKEISPVRIILVHPLPFIYYTYFFSGDTIRIFRRSRSGRPTSAQSAAISESQDDKLLRTEDLPAPDTIAGVKEANAK